MKSGPFLCKPLHAAFAQEDTEPSSPSSSHSSGSYQNGDSVVNVNETQPFYSRRDTDLSLTSSTRSIRRHLTLFDLVSIGVGGTVGSGIFVLCGFIANKYAGPSTCICWIISGAAACLSGVSYAELACRMPSAGSSYVYVYASMGELPAVLVAACLSLEYVVSGSAVARSWGDKVLRWLIEDVQLIDSEEDTWLNPGYNFNPLAAMISAASVILLMNGVKESKTVTNFFTVVKVLLVGFMAFVGMILMKPTQNMQPFLPPQFGIAGILRGATSSFFGFIGFDEVACMAGEAINPQRNLPLSIVYTLAIVTALYVAAAIALTGMQPYVHISDVSGFPAAFRSNGWDWAAQITAFGEVFTLPIVVLISLMAQPRLQYALARDGLLPPIFAKVDRNGNLWWGTVLAGILMIVIAAFVPFDNLNDMISAGILVAFAMTDASLVLMRYDAPDGDENYGLVDRLLWWFNLCSFGFSVAVTHFWEYGVGKIVTVVCAIVIVRCVKGISRDCIPATVFGGKARTRPKVKSSSTVSSASVSTSSFNYDGLSMNASGYFKTPGMPFVPCLGMFVNWYLIAQLELMGIGLLLVFLACTALFYFSYGRKHSVGNNGGWDDVDADVNAKSSFENDDVDVGEGELASLQLNMRHK